MPAESPWSQWLQRWDVQQTGYLPDRERRFDIMLDAVVRLRGERARILDLACGPGSISQRFLARCPDGSSLAVDLDPVLLELGRRSVGDGGGRLRFEQVDLADPDWPAVLGDEPIDAVLTTTALHWLRAEDLVRVYWQLGDVLPAGALVLNGDHMAFPATTPTLTRLVEEIKQQRQDEAFVHNGVEDYEQWWAALEKFSDEQPAAEQLPFEAKRQLPQRKRGERRAGFDLHASALRSAGFAEVDVIWSNLDNRILAAVR